MSYTLNRQDAASILHVSTRTLDRYIKKGKLSHKKVSNQVLLQKEEVVRLATELNQVHQSHQSEVVQEVSNNSSDLSAHPSINLSAIDEKIDKFFDIFQEKEKIINNKDKMIFMLQQRIGELETKMKNMIALPDYSQEKQSIMVQKQKLQDTIAVLKKDLKTEKTKSFVVIGMILIIVLVVLSVLLFNGTVTGK